MDYISKTTHDGRNVRVKDYKKRVKRNRRRRKILFFTFLLLCVILFLRFTPFFNIKEIRCVGNNVVSNEQIISASTISYNYNIFRTSINKAENLIKALPYVQNAQVKRKFPNIIKVTITECSVYGYIPLNEGYIYIDENCRMLEFNNIPPQKSIPIIQNTGVQSFEGGIRLLPDDVQKVDLITAVLNALTANSILEKITIIDVTSIDKLTLFYNNRLEILVGSIKDIDYKVNFALRIINDKLGENPKGFINVSDPGNESGSEYREKK